MKMVKARHERMCTHCHKPSAAQTAFVQAHPMCPPPHSTPGPLPPESILTTYFLRCAGVWLIGYSMATAKLKMQFAVGQLDRATV